MVEAMHETMYELCMENLKEKDCDLKLTGKCKKCYDYSADQFILNYISGESISTIADGIRSGEFYDIWESFLCAVKYTVDHGSFYRGIEDIVNNSGISRKTWIKFVHYYFSSER